MKQPIIAMHDDLWAGTEGSLHSVLARLANIEGRMAPQAAGYVVNATKEAEKLPYLFSIQGSVGIVEIKGGMTNATSYWDAYDKAATYQAISEAMIHAANDSNVKAILLDIDSGGGSVAGMNDTADLIRTINDNVKPVVAFTGGSMFSAAYCLGCSAGQVFASKSAGAGSIGIIGTHMDLSKMYAEQGITVTVVRGGKYKALANRFEALTDDARSQIQAGIDAAYGVFVQHVADMRGVPYLTADTQMAQGKEFWGQSALTAGLVDGITTFDAVVTLLQQSVDKQQGF